LDRFSPNFDYANEIGFVNVRPLKSYRYLYPFDTKTLFDLAYYFDCDYKKEIDSGGYIGSLNEAIWRWKNSKDQLYAQDVAGKLIIYDSRPVATSPQISLTNVGRYIYEYCDQIRGIRKIQEWLQENYQLSLDTAQIKVILDEFVGKQLMIHEGNQYLSLAVLMYTPEYILADAGSKSHASLIDALNLEVVTV
jgi:hypothetical protein